jgi:hypothetical protein
MRSPKLLLIVALPLMTSASLAPSGVSAARPAAPIVRVTDGQPHKRVEVGEPWFTFQLPSAQDYRITARVASGAGTATYALAIAITPK